MSWLAEMSGTLYLMRTAATRQLFKPLMSAATLDGAASKKRALSFAAGPHVSGTNVHTSTPLPLPTQAIESAKRLAAFAAVAKYVKPEHKIIGIGSGTTIPYCIEALLKQGHDLNAEVSAVERSLKLFLEGFEEA